MKILQEKILSSDYIQISALIIILFTSRLFKVINLYRSVFTTLILMPSQQIYSPFLT